MRRFGMLLVTIVLVTGAEDKTKGAGKAELSKFQGVWTAVSFEANGEKAPEDAVKKIKFTVKDHNWKLERGDNTNNGTLTLDPSKSPKEFDAALEDGGQVVLGLYEIKGDTLKMCWSAPGGDRPAALKADEGKTLAVFKKAKAD